MDLRVGAEIGPYTILGALGAGGMGVVYRARDRKLGRDVAIKVLPDVFTSDPERLARFEREARALASLNHPNIGAIYGHENAGGAPALVLELVEGSTLADRLATGPLSIDEALPVARQIADALDAAHEQGIVHRDLKPANIKITPNRTVKVLDFGLAKSAVHEPSAPDPSDSPTITADGTRAGVILGTTAYMSPEQARAQPVDRRTDIWAFGSVLYEMLTARRAFRGDTTADIVSSILSADPDWAALPAATPDIVRRLLRRCLERDPKRRLRDIGDARADIDAVLGGPAMPISTSGRRAGRHRLAGPLVWLSVAAVLAVVAAWVAYSSRSQATPAVVGVSVLPARGSTFPTGSPWPSLSPDGRQVAFTALTSGQQQLWIRSLDATTPRALQGTEGGVRPFWSPNSRSIAFFANGQLKRLDLGTGSLRVLCDAPYLGGLAGTWGDGVIVFSQAAGLYRVSADGGTAALLLARSDGPDVFDVNTPSFLPNGRQFLYLARRSPPERSQVCVASIDSTETTCVVSANSPARYAPPGYLLFVRDGLLQAQPFDPTRLQASGEPFVVADEEVSVTPPYAPAPFSASDNGVLAYYSGAAVRPLALLDRSGKLEARIGSGVQPSLSPDEQRIVFSRRDRQSGNVDLWVYDRSRGAESKFTFDPAADTFPSFSPDGARVVFWSVRNGRAGVYEKLTSGVGREELVAPLTPEGSNPHWSSDGRFILYQLFDTPTSFDLWAFPLVGDRKPFPVVQTEHGERAGRFSPDVRWVAYDSTASGRREVWVQPFPPAGGAWQISTTGGVIPRWREDGKELFYVAADGMLMAVAVRAADKFEWDAPQALFQTMFRGESSASYSVSNSGQQFVMNVPPGAEDVTPITIVVNWTAALRR